MNQDDEGFSSFESKQALQSLKSLAPEPSRFLKTRLLARLEEQSKQQVGCKPLWTKSYFFSVALSSSFVLCLIYFGIKYNSEISEASTIYKTGLSYVIRLDIRPLKDAGVSYAEINLSDKNIQFSSTEVLDVIQNKKLVVAWDSIIEKQFLPIVIQGIKPGVSSVMVNFYNLENKLVKSQNIKLDFKGG